MYDLAIVGGGILGLATAHTWLARHPGRSLVLLEKESELAAHQTGHNSGVLHSGLYYAPGSEKAHNCRRGKAALEAFCERAGVAVERVGKLVVATEPRELEALAQLEERGRRHGVELARLDPDGIRALEPVAGGLAGLHLPETAIVDFRAVAAALAESLRAAGGELRLGARVLGIDVAGSGEVRLDVADQGQVSARRAIACAGLQADRVARAAGIDVDRLALTDGDAGPRGLRTVPFLGQYFDLIAEHAAKIRGLIYPVPDARFPFLGVHLTRRLGRGTGTGSVDVGPNAVLALAREGYGRGAGGRLRLADAASALTWPGTWRLLARHAPVALGELVGSLSKAAFARRAARLVPGLEPDWLVPGSPGVRAQALGRDGALVDDYVFARRGPLLQVLNAPSPAATSCLAIAERLIDDLAGDDPR